MKNKKIISIIFFALILVLFSQIVFSVDVANTAEEKDILSKLNTYYESSKAENVNNYISVQDTEFLNIIAGKDYQAYIEAAFKETETLSYEVVSPKVIIMDKDQAFIFYELKAKMKITSTGETKDIDNSMVCALWKYDTSGWKIRYTMLRSLFDEKMQIEVFSEAAFDNMINIADVNSTLKQQFVKENLINPKDESLYNKSSASLPMIPILIVLGLIILIALGVFGFKMMRKKKHKTHHAKNE